ncbi:hypothetical protein C8R45DRAFT_1033798 [Mycena sanguinolenta]|nr:hypothetical protein C8R45DRAFT_1033798 [Mycena sanguinolenta]
MHFCSLPGSLIFRGALFHFRAMQCGHKQDLMVLERSLRNPTALAGLKYIRRNVSLNSNLPGSALSLCANNCLVTAAALACTENLGSAFLSCICTNANLRFDLLSCVQGECQAPELENAQQFLASNCGTSTCHGGFLDVTCSTHFQAGVQPARIA